MRLAWFSPMPPVRSGIAVCSAELVDRLRPEHDIDVFVDEPQVRQAGAPPGLRSAHDFLWRHQQAPYDLTVYQLGNSSHHDFLWPYLFRVPGLAVLHDAHLHHARAAALLRERRAADYRAEFAACQPETPPDAAELAVAGFDSPLLYQWPFTRLVVRASRGTAVHSQRVRDQLIADNPGAAVEHIRLGHGTRLSDEEAASRGTAFRQRHGVPAGALLFGCFGGLTPDKRVPQILDAFDAIRHAVPDARLLLAGAAATHYDVAVDVSRRAPGASVIVTGYLEDDESLTDAVAASDVTLNLRWPTAREVSGPWLRALAAGRPSIVIDLAHMADLPTLDPRTWRTHGGTGAEPVAVALDILDEDHSLRLAMRRLAQDPALRTALGRAGRRHWESAHSHDAMLDDYRRVIARTAEAHVPDVPLPAHLRPDGGRVLREVLEPFGVPIPWSKI